jgi:TolB-like protein/tetratricopeptide (TPR) repeat protein
MDPGRWRTVRILFDELVELDAAARTRRIAEIGFGDPDLGDRLLSLLAADERTSGAVRTTAVQEDSAGKSVATADWLGLVGRQISHFHVLEALGAGGMGVVYRAEDLRLSRAVALKFPLPHTRLDPNSRTRFLFEARAVAALDHPNLCTIYDVGETPEGQLFIAMALYEGETLASRLARESCLGVDAAVSIVMQVAAGLACAHSAGVVHRDLKPANIMLPVDGSVRLLDFGLAKSDELSLSQPGAAMGTLPYMAPERLSGGKVDERSDLWAVGVILYQLLTGRRPFDGSLNSAIGQSVLTAIPVAPSSLRAEVSPSLNACVLRLLEKDPELRYPSADALLKDLAAVARGAARVPEERLANAKRRPALFARYSAAPAVGLFAFVAAAIAIGILSSPPSEPPAAIAVLPFVNLSSGAEFDPIAAGLHDDLVTRLATLEGIRVASLGAVAPYAKSTLPRDRIARALGATALLEATVQKVPGAARFNVRLIDPASGTALWAEAYDADDSELLTLHIEIAAAVAAHLGVRLSTADRQELARLPTKNPRAREAYWQGRFYTKQLTPPALQLALAAFDRAIALDSSFASAWAGKSQACVGAVIALLLRELEPCIVAAQTALALDGRLSEAHSARAQARTLQWDWERAEAGFLQALAFDPGSDAALQGYGQLLRMLERPDEAITQFRRASRESPENLLALTQVGWVLFDEQRFREALAQYDAVIRRDPTYWLPVYNKGLVYAILRDSTRLRETIDLVTPLTVQEAPHVALLRGQYLAIRGDREGALASIERVCGAPDSVRCLGPRAGVLHMLGEDGAALSLLERAAQLRDPWLPNVLSEPWFDDLGDHPRLAALRKAIGIERP